MTTRPTFLKESQHFNKDLTILKRKKGIKIVDIYSLQVKELFEVKNPGKKFKGKPKIDSGEWVFYPWSNILLHTLSEKENDLLRTNRNRDIITQEEQERLRNFTIVIAGLSVGGNIAMTLVYNGISKHLKLADFDILETTNLNRVRGKLSDIGEAKIDIINKQLYELDPYIKITNFNKGLDGKNVKDFLKDANLVFEIIDDLKLKILIRKEAQKHKIPLVMLTSIGDSVMIDVERYDLDPQTKVFNGLVDERVVEDILQDRFSKAEMNKYVVRIVGVQNIPPRVMKSVKQIGKTLSGRPQLMSTVTVAAGLACFIAKRIALGDQVLSGRKICKFEDIISR